MVVVALAILGVLAVVIVARRVPAARMWCALVTIEAGYLLVAPNFFTHYSAWLAPAAAIVLGTAASLAIHAVERSRPLVTLARVGAVAVVAAMALAVPRQQGTVIERTALEVDIRNARCVSADDPELLIETSALKRDLRDGCQLIVDPTGTSYETDRGRLAAGPVGKARLGAPGYQFAMEEWYDDSNAALFARATADGLDPATREEIADELPVVVDQGNVTVLLPGRIRSPEAQPSSARKPRSASSRGSMSSSGWSCSPSSSRSPQTMHRPGQSGRQSGAIGSASRIASRTDGSRSSS